MSRLRLRMAPTVVCWCCIIWDMEICVTWSIPSLWTLLTNLPFLSKRSTSEWALDSSVVVLVDLSNVSSCSWNIEVFFCNVLSDLTYNIND